MLLILLIIGVSTAVALFTPQGKNALTQMLYYYPCAKPEGYKIGSIDSRFNLSRDTVLSDLRQAASVWNSAMGKTLLVYDPQAQLTVNMVYDQRQSLDSQLNSLNQSVSQDKSNLQPQIDQYKQLSQDFQTKLANLNQQIDYWNSQGGAPSDVYNSLTTQQQQLQTEADQLNTLGKSLNQSTEQYNGKIGQLNQTITNFNQTLAQKPEEGVFDPNTHEIDIYFDNSRAELIHTMAHEMGHSLGLGHNQGTTSIMNPHTNEYTTASLLDIEAIQHECQRQSRWNIFVGRIEAVYKTISSQVKI